MCACGLALASPAPRVALLCVVVLVARHSPLRCRKSPEKPRFQICCLVLELALGALGLCVCAAARPAGRREM